MIALGSTGATAGLVVMRATLGDREDWLDAGVNTLATDRGDPLYRPDAGLVQISPTR